MKRIIILQTTAIVMYILGNNWYFLKSISETETSTYQVKLVSIIPQWLPVLLFVITLVLLIKYKKQNS